MMVAACGKTEASVSDTSVEASVEASVETSVEASVEEAEASVEETAEEATEEATEEVASEETEEEGAEDGRTQARRQPGENGRRITDMEKRRIRFNFIDLLILHLQLLIHVVREAVDLLFLMGNDLLLRTDNLLQHLYVVVDVHISHLVIVAGDVLATDGGVAAQKFIGTAAYDIRDILQRVYTDFLCLIEIRKTLIR